MNSTATIGERIAARRKALRLKQMDVAVTAGFPASTLSKFEHGKQAIKYPELERLASALSCAVHDLIPPPKTKPTLPVRNRHPRSKRSAA